MSTETMTEIERLLADLSREEQLRLIEKLAQRLQRPEKPAAPTRSLRGILSDPAYRKVDVDATLREVRSGWLEDLEDPEA